VTTHRVDLLDRSRVDELVRTTKPQWVFHLAAQIDVRYSVEHPDGDAAAYVTRGVSSVMWRYRARVRVHAPAQSVTERVPPAWVVEAIDERTCAVDAGADTPHMLAVYLGALDCDFDVTEPPELVDHLRKLAGRYRRATPPCG